MSDLIDRRLLFDAPIFYDPDNENYDDFRKGWNACNKAWLKFIRELPAAYDVDKVVERLNAEAVCGRLPVTLAVEIVKKGGTDEINNQN